jgi:hypothetical protein
MEVEGGGGVGFVLITYLFHCVAKHHLHANFNGQVHSCP